MEKHGVFYYSALDTSETNGEDAIPVDLIVRTGRWQSIIAGQAIHCIR